MNDPGTPQRPSPGLAGRPAGDRPRAGRGPPRRDRSPAECLPLAGRPLLLRGAHARRGGPTAPMPGRHGPQPTGPGAGQAPSRPHPTRRRPARRRTGRGLDARSASASVSSPLCDITTRAAIELRGRTGRRALGGGPCPGGAEIHAAPQAETHRVDPAVPRRRRRRRGVSGHALAMKDEPTKADRPRPPIARSRTTPTRSRPRAGCSSSAACSTRRASRCRTRR